MTGLLTVASITSIVVVLFTLAFQLFPGLRVWWGGLASTIKVYVIIGIYLVTGAVVAFGGCFPAFATAVGLPLLCVTLATFLQFVFGVLIAVGPGQGVLTLIPEKADVTAAKAARV